MTFGERVKQARLAKGLTQGELAKAIGARASTISGWEGLGAEPISSFLVPLAKALDTDPNTLLGWEEPKKTIKVKVRRIKREPKITLTENSEGL